MGDHLFTKDGLRSSQNSKNEEYMTPGEQVFLIFRCLLAVVGVFGNSTVVYIYFKFPSFRKSNINTLITALAVADTNLLIVFGLTYPLKLTGTLRELSKGECKHSNAKFICQVSKA